MKRISLLLFASIVFIQYADAQIPSDPMFTKEDSVRAVQGHQPGRGFSIIERKEGSLVFSAYASVRYLNQSGLDDTYTDYFGRPSVIKKRNDLQFQKVMLYFKGWLFDPKFRYLFYVWTSNTSQGQSAQVVVAGNLQYQFNKYLDLGVGIGGLPTNRSLIGNFPAWLRQDTRTLAEEFFRGSFTTGIWLQGELANGLFYKTMLGNNLSQLGIDAGQLDKKFDSWSTALWWTTNSYGRMEPYGDFEKHEKPATTLGASFTSSSENRQSQPGSEAPENSQIRLSDGTGLFSLNAFNNGSNVTDAKYHMSSFNGGVKLKGFSFDADYFIRWVDELKGTGSIPVDKLSDNGFSLQASGMIVDRKLQAYGTYSKINGQYGDPSEYTLGLNWFPFKTKAFRVNGEYINVKNSPVGYLSYPTVVGANGSVFMINLELFY
ncbi:MAG TPA: hypothetical protein VK166_07845 [Chitinophagaceae bacterium]|nr:hypothetical protein [Chitinophagaceae bacterium]